MKLTRVTAPSWFSLCSLSSLFIIAFAGPTLAEPHGLASSAPHGDGHSIDTHHGKSSAYMGTSTRDQHDPHEYPSMKDSHHAQGKEYKSSHTGMSDDGHRSTHQGTTAFINHILKFKKGMSVTAEQEQQLHDLKTQYKKNRITMKAKIKLANIDLHELLRDEKASLAAIETELKTVQAFKTALYMASIKTKRDAKAVLSEEQQSRMDTIHERIKSHGGNMGHPSGYSRGEKSAGR